jgi:uncharacterized membrane protein
VTESRLRAAIAALAVVGAGIAAYLTYTRYSGAPIACGAGGCETVQRSRYAELGGIPVAVLGLGAYLAILAAAAARGPAAAATGSALALGGAAFSLYLLAIQIFVIGAICQWCVTSDAVMVLLAAAATVRLFRTVPPRTRGWRPAAGSADSPQSR